MTQMAARKRASEAQAAAAGLVVSRRATTRVSARKSKSETPRTKRAAPIPVTLLSGFLGAGKTTLLKCILQDHQHGLKIAVVVNDMGAVNLDAGEIKRHKLVQEKAQMVELQNGCICCTLRGDLLKTVKELSEETVAGGDLLAWDYIVIESSGISEPLPVAQTFVMDVGECNSNNDDDNKTESVVACPLPKKQKTNAKEMVALSHYARLDTLVTVVDMHNVLHLLGTEESVAERERLLGDEAFEEHDEEDDSKEAQEPAGIAQLLVSQLEFANVILLNKADLVHPDNAEQRHRMIMQVYGVVRKLNPDARIIVPGYKFDFEGKADATGLETVGTLGASKFVGFDVGQVLGTQLFDMEKAQMGAGWIQELEKDLHGGGHTPETEEYGIRSFVWRTNSEDPRPFHPVRLHAILKGFGELKLSTVNQHQAGRRSQRGKQRPEEERVFSGVVRAKGQLWVAFGHAFPVNFHVAGRQVEYGGGEQPFRAAVPREYWDEDDHEHYRELAQQGRWHTAPQGRTRASDGVAFGDRASQLVCIGLELTQEREQRIVEALNGALMTDAEMEVGVKAFKNDPQGDCHPWKDLEDPFLGGDGAHFWKVNTEEVEEDSEAEAESDEDDCVDGECDDEDCDDEASCPR